ncbi:MAG: hypothetical protein ACOH1E_08875 [Brevundimonas sp.]
MKPLLIAAALFLIPAAAQAQVAAGALPNTFDGPAQAAPAQPSTPPPAATPANARSEEVLREIIAGAQAGAIDYSLMTDDLGGKVREQEAQIQPLIEGFGLVQAVDFVGQQDGADLFAVTFANAATQWVIGFDEADKVAALLFRPAE